MLYIKNTKFNCLVFLVGATSKYSNEPYCAIYLKYNKCRLAEWIHLEIKKNAPEDSNGMRF